MPSDLALKTMNTVHRVVQRVTFGKLGWQAGSMAVVELTTIGRKSGEPRTTMLTAPVHDDTSLVLVASYGGDDREPAWCRNLRANPKVTITMKGRTREMTARIATDDEKANLWPQITKAYKGYAGYQEKTDRNIPVVIVEE